MRREPRGHEATSGVLLLKPHIGAWSGEERGWRDEDPGLLGSCVPMKGACIFPVHCGGCGMSVCSNACFEGIHLVTGCVCPFGRSNNDITVVLVRKLQTFQNERIPTE